MKKIFFSIITIMIILSFFIISYMGSVTKIVIKPNSIEHAKAGLLDDNLTGLVKGGTIENFNTNMPKGTIFFDKNKADTVLLGKDGYTLETYGNQNIVNKDIKVQENVMENRVTYLGPNGNGIPASTEGYITNTGIDANASENNRSKFSMKFEDVVTMQDASTKDVIITISNIYVVNQKTVTVPLWVSWRGAGVGVNSYDNDFNRMPVDDKGMAMHCDISINVINKDGTPVKDQKLLLEVKDLDISDRTRMGDDQNAYPKANDTRFNQGLTAEQKLALYDSDYRESIQILSGAVSDAYMPETNKLEVKRLADGNNANGLRFISYTPEEDDATLNTGFHVLVDSEESNYRWYGSSTVSGISTILFTNSANHKIKATSSTGGGISNYITSREIIDNTDNHSDRSYLNYFADGLNITYLMDAKENSYLEKLTIDEVDFVQNDFMSVASGERNKSVTVTKNENNYRFNVTKDSNGKITNVVYTFSNNNADHEISVVWKGNGNYITEYYYDNEIDDTKTETKSAPFGTVVNEYTDKVIDGYKLQKVEGTPLTISDNSTNNVIKVYYIKRDDLSYTVKYLEKGTNNELHEQKNVDNQTYGNVINSSNEVINIDSYKYVDTNRDSITISTSDNTIILYYEKDIKYTAKVKYYEKGTTNELKEEVEIPELRVGDIIKTEDYFEPISGYVFDSSDPENLTISEDAGKNIVIIYYKKDNEGVNYTINYLDKETNKVIHDQKVVDKPELNSVVEAKNEIIEIDNYTFDSYDKDQITISDNNSNNVINLYYNKKKGNVIVKYIDEETNEEIGEKYTITGYVNDSYIAKAKEIQGYDLSKTPDNASGIITEGETTVVYYYKAKKAATTETKQTTETQQAKKEVATLPKTGNNINSIILVISVTLLISLLFGIGYVKLKDIK